MKKYVFPSLTITALILYCAFSQGGFIAGMQVLGEIVNIFGTIFVMLLKLIFSIPQVAKEIIKRVLTTVIILGLTTWWCVEDKTEKKIVSIIAKVFVAVIMLILSWVGMF